MVVKINKIFDLASKNNLFSNKFILQTSYNPDIIPHRDEQIEQIATILAPALRGERTSNLFIYGKTGTGKTASMKHIKNVMLERAKKADLPLRVEYLNCKLKKVSDTEYRILAELIKKLGGYVPATGLPTDQVYNKFVDLIEQEKKIIILILDEIDQAIAKISDSFLYNLTRLNTELSGTQISVVGISNDLKFLDNLDPRVRSSLSEEEIIFPPYNALQLQGILDKRAKASFKSGVLGLGVIQKCAALAAREHGDARRALDLLRVSGELAEREGNKKIGIEHVDKANEKIDKDKILEVAITAPKQFQLTLLAIISLSEENKLEKFFTGDVYNVYHELCSKAKIEVLTQRRISDLIADLDMLGLINARVISKGRHGRTREIKLAVPKKVIERVKINLKENLEL